MVSQYHEKKVLGLSQLRMLIEGLELDEGIRIRGYMPEFSKGGFIFITRPTGSYCINLCDVVFDERLRADVPGGRESWHYVSKPEEVWKMVKSRVKIPLEAWLY